MTTVFISIPSRSGFVYFELMMRILGWSHSKNFKAIVDMVPFHQPIDSVRNMIAKKFIKSKADYLLMVDDDIVPPPGTIDQLLAHKKDIVAAACPIIGPDPYTGRLETNYNGYKKIKDNYEFFDPPGEMKLYEVDAVGTGCILISKHAMITLKAPLFFNVMDNNGIKVMGEDIYFCNTARTAGFKIYMDYALPTKHMKLCNLAEL